jgi:hypothetical protein
MKNKKNQLNERSIRKEQFLIAKFEQIKQYDLIEKK